MEETSPTLHLCNVSTKTIRLFNRCYMSLHANALWFLFLYRASYFGSTSPAPTYAWMAIFLGELFQTFQWILNQAHWWRPVKRTAFPERLLLNDPGLLSSIDVFVCRADPDMEPTINVMNTVMLAMALDYPLGRLHIYMSDDGDSPRTLNGMREAYKFARDWIPFGRKYSVKTISPKVYFEEEDEDGNHPEYNLERKKMKVRSEANGDSVVDKHDHPLPYNHSSLENRSSKGFLEGSNILVYVAREKSTSYHHKLQGRGSQHNWSVSKIGYELLRVSAWWLTVT